MPDFTPNFILGHGERLTRQIPPPPGGGGGSYPYTLDEAVARLAPMLRQAVNTFDQLPRLACPNDEVVGVMTLHPARMAKSYYPSRLMESAGLRAVGSRPARLTPEKSTRSAPEAQFTTELYVAGSRTALREWARALANDPPQSFPEQLRGIEAFRAPSPQERLKPGLDAAPDYFEVVLHATPTDEDEGLLDGFTEYAHSLQVEPITRRLIFAGGLCFVPVQMSNEVAPALARFSFLRTARPMPRLRSLSPIERSVQVPGFCELPDEDAVDPDVSIAVFDGGIRPSALDRWVTAHEPSSIGDPDDAYLDHGHSVTSALLFGSLLPGTPATRPYTRVDHYRVLDQETHDDPLELFDVLIRIADALSQRQYEFVSLSIGPALPVEDDDVHVWTAKLDEIFSAGSILAGIAVGNTGESDRGSGIARVQVPSDSVNSLAIGAADSATHDWHRAPYSSVGPGRSPGLIKPDLLSFGGCEREPFYVYAQDVPMLNQTAGTSFSTPSTIRLAAAIRAHFGDHLTPASLKALLINTAAPGAVQFRHETGWGRAVPTLEELVICPDATVRVVYQGRIRPGGWIRAALPLPEGNLEGQVTITASFCFFAAIDPQDPSNYTRAGLEVVFRPNADKTKPGSTNANSTSFFRTSDFMTEQQQRQVALKWETTLHGRRSFRASTLARSTFDFHYNARERGAQSRVIDELDYGLVVSVTSPKTPDLYNRVVTTYATQLEILNPVVSIPVTIR